MAPKGKELAVKIPKSHGKGRTGPSVSKVVLRLVHLWGGTCTPTGVVA